jgi:AP-2 complex subunit sigma-1
VADWGSTVIEKFQNYKVVYRRYAGLFFCVCVDANDNELAYLEAIHLFVEILGKCEIYFHDEEERMTEHGSSDAFFDNVCELDLVFNFYKASTAYSLSLSHHQD